MTTPAQAEAQATRTKAEAELYAQQKQAEGLLARARAQAEGLRELLGSSDPSLVKFYLALDKGLFGEMADKTAAAIQVNLGLQDDVYFELLMLPEWAGGGVSWARRKQV